jgi:hypothetical protein
MKIYLKPGQSFKFDNGLEVEVEGNYGQGVWDAPLFSSPKLTGMYNADPKFMKALQEIANFKNEVVADWYLPSETSRGTNYHVCLLMNGTFTCECKDFLYRHKENNTPCKHIRNISWSHEINNHNKIFKVYNTLTNIAKEALK